MEKDSPVITQTLGSKSALKLGANRASLNEANFVLFFMCLFIVQVDGVLGKWTEWTACPVTCGNGTRTSNRTYTGLKFLLCVVVDCNTGN